jgi:hypothetical protein
LPEDREPVFAVFQSRRNLNLRVKVFLKFLEERLAQSTDWGLGTVGGALPTVR